MPLRNQINVDLYQCHRDQWEDCLQSIHTLSNEETKKFSEYKIDDDKKRFCAGRVIVRTVVGKQLKIPAKNVEITANKHGKPYIKDSSKLFFNISHSGDWVVVAFCESEIGVDIQEINPKRKLDINNVAKHAFHDDEISYLENLDPNSKNASFYTIWTLKEAFVKAKGIGFYENIDKISVIPIIRNKGSEIENLFLKTKHIDNNYKLAIATLDHSIHEILLHTFNI